jgi:cysteine desulfurase
MQAVNTEPGARPAYAAVAAALKRRNPRALFHLDAVQGLCEMRLNLKNVDLVSVSAHKIGGIKGAGALYVAPGLHLQPRTLGGGQESGLRPGTEPMPAIAAFGAACNLRMTRLAADAAHLAALKSRLLAGLAARGVTHRVNSPAEGAAHIVNLSLFGAPSEVWIRSLSDAGICVSAGSACKRGKSSHVLLAMGLPPEIRACAVRVSFSPRSTVDDVDALVAAAGEIQARLTGVQS